MATVVRVESPSSARPGDKALITADGKLWGWVGGSCSEGLVRREALAALEDGQPRLVRIAPEQASDHTRGVIRHASTCPSAGTLDVFIDPQLPRPLLLVIGATPIARTLVRLGSAVGFRTCAVHPGASAEDFPEADLVLGALDVSRAGLGRDSWCVVATMGHYDEDALATVLPFDVPYVGLIASRRRTEAVLDLLKTRGVTGFDRIRRPAQGTIRAPLQEIALVTLSEIVAERRAHAPLPGQAAGSPSPRDPVCGMMVEVGEAIHVLREGQAVHYFCSAHCRDAFTASPQRYLGVRA